MASTAHVSLLVTIGTKSKTSAYQSTERSRSATRSDTQAYPLGMKVGFVRGL